MDRLLCSTDGEKAESDAHKPKGGGVLKKKKEEERERKGEPVQLLAGTVN